MTSYREEQLTQPETRRVDFGIKDDKGRECGMVFNLVTVGFSEIKNPGPYEYGYREPKPPYRLYASAARDGKQFGATQCYLYFKTKEEREAAITKRIKETKARYAKKFG